MSFTPLFRRRDTVMISCTAAPEGDVMIPIARGRRGSGFFRDSSKSPSFVSFSFSASYACIRSPIPCRRIALT